MIVWAFGASRLPRNAVRSARSLPVAQHMPIGLLAVGAWLQVTGSRHKLLLNLLYRALKFDPSLGRVRALAKRVLQVALHSGAPMTCGTMYLLSAVMTARPAVARAVVSASVYLPLHLSLYVLL